MYSGRTSALFRDWDILSLPALPLTLWATVAFLNRIRDSDRRFHSAFLISGAAALHTFLWIGPNTSAELAEARYVDILQSKTGRIASSGWGTLAIYHMQRNDTLASLHAYQRARDTNPSSVRYWLAVSRIYRDLGLHANAIENLKKEIEHQPDHAAAANANIGTYYRSLGDTINAIEHLRKAIELQPDFALAHEHLAEMYQGMGENVKAIHHLERANSLRPRNTRILVNLAIALSDVGTERTRYKAS